MRYRNAAGHVLEGWQYAKAGDAADLPVWLAPYFRGFETAHGETYLVLEHGPPPAPGDEPDAWHHRVPRGTWVLLNSDEDMGLVPGDRFEALWQPAEEGAALTVR